MSQPQGKQYGLIHPKKHQVTVGLPLKKPSIFEEDSDSDEGPPKPTGISRSLKRQEILAQERAVEEDPTIFQYDEVYDEIDKQRKESKLSRKDLDRKPKYISKLLKAAEKRKLENERRIERQVQREREAEGNQFKDKESFVTSAYKKKLEELKQQEELEKREDYLEAIGDVTKQGNLDGFYRHLYEQKVNYNEEREKKMEEIKIGADCATSKTIEKESDDDGDNSPGAQDLDKPAQSNKTSGRKRQYRKREDSKSQSDNEEMEKGQIHLPSNLDADSDFSIDSDSDEPNEEPKEKVSRIEMPKVDQLKNSKAEDKITSSGEESKEKTENGTIESKETVKEPKPKIDIWKKRTVGAVFDAALQRYFERRALRTCG